MNKSREQTNESNAKTFLLGLVLAGLSGWFFVDSVQVTSTRFGFVSRGFGRFGGSGSIGVLFLPLMIGVALLFYDSKKKAGWLLAAAGIAIIGVEALSRVRFLINLPLSQLLLMLVGFAAGLGLVFRSIQDEPLDETIDDEQDESEASENSQQLPVND